MFVKLIIRFNVIVNSGPSESNFQIIGILLAAIANR